MSKKQSPLQTFPEDSPGWHCVAACTKDRNLKDIAVYMHKEQTAGLWELRFRIPDPYITLKPGGWEKDRLASRLIELGLQLQHFAQSKIDESEELEFGF
jgi:hypothetical protein